MRHYRSCCALECDARARRPEMPGVQSAIIGHLVGAPFGGAVGIVVRTFVAFRLLVKKSDA